MADAETSTSAMESSTGSQMPQKHSGSTTTISTISLQSGETRLVIALLQSAERLQLKVLEGSPETTHLGATLPQALALKRQHEEVILQLQSKQSPVEELLRQADQLISAQRPRAEVYAAMAESLGVAWKDVNSYLDLRKHILDLNVSYQSRAEECIERMLALETACRDTNVPVEIEAVKNLLAKLHDFKRMMLEALMVTLQNGRALHEKMSELAAQGTLDSRPHKITSSANFSISQIEHWLEELHDRRKVLEVKWQSRKTQLEQCLSLSLLAKDLKELDEVLFLRKEALQNTSVQMGDSASSAELILHEHRKLINEAREFQDRCLKITKATEKLTLGGHFAGEQATIQAYAVLNASVEYLEALEERDALLKQSVAFFRSSRTALTKLDQIEIQLTTTEHSLTNSSLVQLHFQVSKSLEEITSQPLQKGYSLLEAVGQSAPGAQGVKCTVQELENRKIALDNLCTAHKEENIHLSKAFTTFLERQNELYSWLVSIAEAFLQGHQDLGSVLAMADDFLQLHQQLLKDLQNKGIEINDVLLTLPPILEKLNDDQRADIDEKVDTLHSHWLNLKTILESRIDLASLYVKFHSLAAELTNEFDAIEVEFRKGTDNEEEDVMSRIEQKWLYIQQMTGQLTNLGKLFIEESSKIGDPYLDVKRASLCVETLLEHFANRQLVITQSWGTWQTTITTEREFNVLWERNIRESDRIMEWISKIHSQLYPVLTGESTAAKIITKELEEKLRTIMPELKRAQTEIELRVKTAETLAMKGEHSGQKETIISKLMVLHNELNDTATDYQILLQMLISLFKKLSEVEKTIENLQSQFNMTRLPNVCSELEVLLKEHEASEQTILELFKFTQNESEQIINRIVQQEPEKAADFDTQRVKQLLEHKTHAWKSAWTARKVLLEEQQQLSQFDSDLQQINSNLSDLSKQLNTLKGQYGESLTSAKATSVAFVYFEKTIQLLENRIQTFMSTTEQILKSEHASSHVESKLTELQTKWSAFMNQVKKSRQFINMNIEYFTLVEEGEKWFRVGSKLLITIARKSTAVRSPHEADQLLAEVENFLKDGELLQQERINKISSLAEELHGEEGSKQVTVVRNENKEMIDSFTIIRKELHILAQNLRAAEEQRERQEKEMEEAEAILATAKAEAAAAKAAATAAEEARRAAETAAKVLQEAMPILEKIEAETTVITSRDSVEVIERLRKSPSPPPKRAKINDEEQRSSPPTFTVPLQDATVQEGQRFTFECRVAGFPVPEVIWYKDGISIQDNPDYRTTYDNGICTLAIEETFSEDSARFTCKATNSEGSAETCATLSVQEAEPEEQLFPPVFTKRMEESSAKEGSTLYLMCTVEGNPLPTVQWFKNGTCIDNSSDYVITYNNGEAVIKFEEIFLEDQGEYTCKASNPLGTDKCSAKLTVEALELPEAPVFITPLSNIMARAGRKIQLECEVKGLPLLELIWTQNSKIIKDSQDVKLQYDNGKGVLTIKEAFPKDAGVYRVVAKNIAGEASSSCNVSVKGRLPTETSDSEIASDFEPIKPSIQLSLKDVCVLEGEKVCLDCIIIGQPEPEVIWYRNNQPVKESSDFQLLFQGDRCTLVIHEAYLEDAGEYKVVAINSGGEASSKCDLTVKSLSDVEPVVNPQVAKETQLPQGTPPKFNRLLTDIVASEGDKVVLECSIVGDPKPNVKWYLDNQELSDVTLKEYKEDEEGNMSLTLFRVESQDKGVYTIKASNAFGEAESIAKLTVNPVPSQETHLPIELEEKSIAPSFKELFGDRTILENTSTKFECVVTGKPKPKVEWSINNEPISSEDVLVSTEGEQQVLTIQNVRKIHSGNVACVAENDAGRATCTARLNVVEPPISSQMHTAENIESSQKEILVKQSIFSSQVLESQSLSTTVIREEGKHITSRSEQTLQRIEQKSPVQVQIQKFKEVQRKTNESSDSEHQSFVTAINKEESQDSSPSSYSTPTASPKHVRKSVAPRFISPLNGRIVDEGAQVILEGIIDGYPPPTISWTKNNQELISLEGKLHINYDHNRVEVILNDATVQDAGKYTCKAVNDIGSASSTADVVVKKTFLPPIFGRRLQARSVKEGERVVLEVEITGIPDPVVTWYKNGQQILSDVPDCAFRTKVQGNCYSLIIEKVSLDYSGQYLVKAVNSKGEASSMADIFVNKQESQTETIIKVIKEDTKESEIEEIISTFTSEVQKEKRDIKPVPVKPVPLGPPVKQNVRHSLPSPSKFVKGEFRESDYESDYESRIPAKWKPGDSDADEPKYKPVHPLLAQKGFSQSPMFTARTPTPPTEFDNPPEFRAPPRPKFEPIEKPSQSCKTDVIRKSSGHHQKVFKPKPITPKTVPPIIATPDLKSKELEALKPGPSPEMGYAPPPPKTKINIAPFEKTTQIETSKIMNISESTEHMHRVVNVQQTTQVIRFGEKEREESDHQSETFPFKTDLGKHRTKRPVPTVPKKFVPGDFYESEYESDLEAVKIKPKWTPGNSDTEEPHYRKVRPPQITHSTREPIEISSSHPPPVSAESNLAATTNTTQAVSIQKSEVQKKNVSSIQKMRTYKSEQNRESQPIGMEVKRQQDIQLQPGEPPEFCFAGNVASVASYVSSKHMSDMTNTFRSKAQQFATDIMTDVGNSRQKAQPEKIISKQENSKDTESEKVLDDPQAYREESRVSEYGTKHIDPDTGLIYFKYDFGYEFGIVLPNEGKKQEGSTSKYPQIDRKQTGDIEVPVIHEKNTKGNENITSKATETRITPVSTKVPQFKPKKFTHFKAVKWEPASESEMSEAEGDSAKMKKSYCSPQSNLAIQKEPHIHIPTTSQWGPAPTSPLSISLSPSLPSLSPCTGATLDSTASPGGSWQGLSPIKSPRVGYGRGNTPTPPSTPSTPRSSSGLIPQHFCKPPSFITTLRDIAVMKGQPVCFECIVQAEPPPNILWAKDGRLLENSVKHQLHFRNGVCRLTLSQASPEDSGTYTCTATNKLGTVKTSGLLQVPEVTLHFEDQDEMQKEYFAHWKATNIWSDSNIHSSDEAIQEMVIQGSLQPAYGGRPGNISPPVFEQIFRNARFAQGGNALFEGKVRGQPKPVVSWTRKGAPLLESGKYRMSYDEQSGKVSLLINTIGPGDEGEYTCTAQNQYGEAICSVYIQPEGQLQPQISGYQKEYAQTIQSMEQTQSTLQRYQKQMSAYGNGTVVEEDFKVDTFEYRLLREVEFRESITRRFVGEIDSTINTVVEHSLGPAVPPQIVQKPRNSKLQEGSVATFEARLTANPRPRLTWFKNGQRITSTQKYQTSFSNQQATLKVQNLSCTDSGHYTLLAENPQGCVVSSAYLAVEPSSIQDGLYGNIREQSKSTVVETTVETDGGKSLAPNFVRVCTDREVTEGKMTRFDCRVTGRPYPDVAWFINGRQVSDDATHKILVNESGNHALMITNVHRSDAGVVSCIARNKSGETSFQCNLLVIEKEQVVAPKFVERFTTVHVKEGEPVVLNARAVGTPVPRITWQKDGVPITPGQNINIRTDSGASTLDIPRAKASDAAWYQCTAQNVAGSTATRARLFVEIPKSSAPQPRRLNLPRPTKVIEPEPQPGPEVIYLRHVERVKPHAPEPQQDQIYPPPQFIIPLSNVQQVEGGRVHFEARIEPVGDPTMRVEWFINGRPLEASSRATTIFRFGFIALDLISIILEDSGQYLCRVTSSSGSVESRAVLNVTARASIEQSSQHPDSLQYIQQLEDYSHYQRQESLEETIYQRPNFIRPLQNLGELQEGRNAHFEAQLTPVSDPSMKVEWYKDGKTITASSRITTLFNFGYVSLNIMHLRVEDAGTYTVRAVNALGEAISSSTLKILARTSVTGDLGIPEQQRYIEKVEELEAYQQQQQYKYTKEVPESTSPPEFKSPIQDQLNIHEGGFAHFEARLEPIGDSTLRTEWLKDGRPVEASSRITTFFNFGYVALTIKYVTTHDIGTYVCCAYNSLGQATTTARLTVLSKQDIILDSQHPGGLEKIQYLEDSSRYSRSLHEETTATQKPRFLGPLKGTNKIVEGQRAHFEVRVEPQNDINMIIEWYFNGKVIMSANRIQTHHDFGYIALDIENVRSEDAGTYTVVARNALGEAQMSATMEVETRSSIDTSSLHHGTYEKTQRLESSKFVEPQYHIEEISKSKPIFVQPLQDPKPVSEGKNIHLECRLEPMGDPTMRVEWFYNGRSITVGSRFRTYYDFGYIALDIVHATSLDSGEYTVRASNHLGSAHTSACVRVISRSDILTESQNEAALEQIQILEDAARHRRTMQEDITILQAPQFTRPLHNIETVEGTNIHLECRLQPVGDPTMRVDWFVNGRPVKTGHRFRPAYDFDYVALDLLSVYAVDSGVYTCQARNQLGEAVTSCSVKIIAKKDLILESQHPSGLEKIQYLEDASKYKRIEHIDEVVNVKPRFVTKPKSLDNMREGQHAHFECKLEPVTDSNLKVEWYKNGRPIIVGHRFRPIHDFGYVALDIIDLIAEDSGVYSCRAVNLVGADETTCSLTCRSTAQIVTGTHNEMGLEQIQHLEDRSKYHRAEFSEEITKQAPIFTTSLKHIEIKEGQRAHFECRLIPVSDPTMKVEWFHNNAPVKSGSRFTETNNFGFVALDITYCYPEDSGVYMCRARNALGEAVTSANLICHSKKSIYLESQHEEALVQLNYLEDNSRYQRQSAQEETVSQAPVFTQPMKDVKCAENQAAHFEARLIPVGDSKLQVEWLRNGVPIQASNRVTTMHDFGYVALNMKYVYPEDSGTYTCRAINELGQAVTSATLVVHSKASLLLESQHEGALEKLQMLEDSSRYQRREEEEVIVKQPPKFTAQLNGPTNLVEGQSAHYECRIEPYPDPNLKVEWFHNGKPLQTGHRFRTTYDFGFAALDILTVYGEDSGEYTCRATNKLGHATSSIKVNVKSRSSIILDTQHEGALQKIQYLEDDSRHKRTAAEDAVILEKPQFGRPLRNIENLPEGLSAHLEATLTPVNDPTMKVEWFCNGKPIPQGHRFKTTYDFGFVALDILYAYAEDSGTYMCKARNAVGEAVTTCSVKVQAKSGLYLDTLDEQRLKKIKDLEMLERPKKVEAEPEAQRPVFITPLNNLEHLKEGEHAHLECRVEPINDANLKIEWFVNGVAIKTGHRFRTTHDFGYVALDVLYTYPEDSGTYMCKATNFVGEAVNTCTISVAARRSIYLESQHPEGLQKIQELEAQGRPGRLEVEEPIPTPPRFITELRGTTELVEGQTAHFEAQVEPLHDPNLRIELYHNGKPLPSASRFHITFDFGYLALDISHIVPEDAGEYSAKAINALGQCTSTISVRVQGKSNIILESQRPEGLEKIRQLEEHTPFRQPDIPEPTRQRPVFTQPLQNIDGIAEGQTAHFECRLIPVGDPTLKVEWFRNEKPLETSSRITKTHDFGYVALDMTHVRGEDNGVYMCRASNTLGEAVTTASMKIKTKANIQLETQHPEGMKKIQQLEQGRVPKRSDEPDKAFEKPIFTQVLTGPSELWESQNAHFECRVVPVGDPSLRFEWYVNGVELKMGSRFHVTHDFGFVTLDIAKVVTEDSGVYMCKAINNAGEAVSSTSMKVKSKSSIMGEPMQPDAWQKIQLKEAEMNKVPEMFVDTSPQQAPVFTTHLTSHEKLVEGQHILLEAQVEPRADPNLRIEWFKNGVALTTGTRIRSTFDFGLVTLTINGLRADDSAIYTCKAFNLHGEAVSTCTIKVEDRHWLLGSSLRPEALPQIEALEQPKVYQTDAPEPVYESPVFITHLNNIECQEGESVHFECRVEPSKDPTLNIEWFVNGKPLPMGARFKSTYDFGYVALDINHAYAEDSGVYMCKATNSKGQASTSGTLKCTSKQNIYLDTQHPQGKAGLEKVEEVDEAYAARLQRDGSRPDQEFPKPIFIVPLNPEFSLGENEALHLECQVEPKEDPNLKVEWYFNGKNLEHGSRFKMTCDFGFVTLHLTDVYERDQGIYTCKAHNKQGEAFTSTTVYCKGKANLIEHTQHPKGAEGLEKIQDLEESLRRQEGVLSDSEEGHPPVFTSQFQNLKNLSEGEIAHFEASLTPVGDQTMTVEWFYNGEALKASHRTRTVHAFGMVVLEILGTKIEDSGNYTCRATNKWGRAEISVELECVEKSKGQKPRFTTQIQSLEGLKDGDSAHFECTLTPVGDPHLKVEWFHNGQPLRHSSRIKTVSDFGFVVLDIAYVQSHDSGEYVCRASNKYGEDFTKATIKCQGKGGVYFDTLQPDSLARIRELETSQGSQMATPTTPVLEPPVFTTHISDVTQLVEGQSAHFEARLTPVNDPNLTVEWFYNGKKLPHGHRYRTFHDFGIVILDILYCYEENSGVYECRAVNKVGQDVTKATLKCVSKANLILDSQLPQGMEGGLEKIQTLEDSLIRNQDEKVSEVKGQAPMFTVPLSNIDSLREGENAHFEARLIPTDDPKLKVEWFWNGKPLKTGSRFRTFCDFGFVILEISPVYPEDSGEYSCRAFNDFGQAVTTATMRVQGKRSIILESQLPKGMEHTIEKIAELEGLGLAPDQPSADEDVGRPPEFITTPVDLTLTENSLAHFECRLTPVNDSSMRVEWFHNGKALSAGSRIKTINDFGFVILEVAGVYQRDSGLYTCKATNRHGEATVSCKLQVRGRQGIILEPQLPSNFRTGTESIQKLEENLYKKDEILAEEEKPNPPKFIVELKDISDVAEGAPIHFECRVEPVGDSSMRIDWFHNGRPFATGSRVHMLNDFGFIVLDMDYTYARDSGEYVCRATNKWGSATTKATLTCKAKHDIVLESQLPQGMSGAKLKELERGPVTKAFPEDAPLSPPKFITQITSVGIGEGEPVHFECRVEPKTDPKLRIEWYRNGKLLPSGHRFRTMYDLGFVSLDILYTYPEDSGEYVCRAVNDLGEDTTRATISCKKLPTIILQNQVPKGMKKSEALMQMEATIKKYTSEIHLTEDDLYDPDKKQPPRFVTQIKDQTTLEEMQSTKFECQLAPVGDPNMKVEWFLNGKPLPHKNRFTPIYDFGYVAMNFGWVYPEDSGEYLCRATNLYGMDETRAVIKTAGKPGIIYESQLPKGMKSIERIREMEAAWQIVPEEPDESEKPKSAPVFVTKPETYTAVEGEPARYCCRVTGFPRPRVMWVVNGHTVVNGTRYKLTYDGMWHLDIPKTRQYDNGKVEVIARNSAGEAIAVADLVVKQRQDDYRNVLKNSPRPWYDYELTQYQRERQETELERVFEERQGQQIELSEHHLKQKIIKEPETEWQQSVKKKKGEDYYSKLKELEEEQVVKESRLRESSHQFAIPGEKVVHKSLAKGMAQSYEEKVERSDTSGVQTGGLSQVSSHTSDTVIDSQRVKGTVIPEPAESAVHGREVHVAKQKQTQKEVRGDLEITRKITATETTEMEHKAKTQERVVQGQVKPAKPPFFTKKIQPCRAFEQDQARFEVEFDGDPLPTVKWYRENFPIVSSADLQIHTFSTKSVLILRQVFMEDSGVFSVIAENRGGTAKCSANLVVEERRRQGRGGVIPPSFLTTIQNTVVVAGQLARFDARITGTKPLDVYWLKNGKKILPDIRHKSLEEDNTYTLLILESLPEDSGKYECVAINGAGEARCDAECFVQTPSTKPTPQGKTAPAGSDQAPTILEPMKGQPVQEGQAVAFKCKISGKPVPQIKWFKGETPIKPSKYFQMQKDGNIYTLHISEAFPEDEGIYKCVASNTAGSVTTSAELKVLAPSTQEISPTLAPMRDVIVPEGNPAQFRTQVSGKPQPNIQWFREGALIPQSADFQMIQDGNNVVLLISTTYEEDSGVFTCRATNSAGQVEISAKLIVKSKN